MAKPHPCLSCGACCAYFRVEFSLESSVPAELSESAGPHKLCMKGTGLKHRPKCVALDGKIGESVRCMIYNLRSHPCRNFVASFEKGERNPRCDEARARHGLAPLKPRDF